MLLTCLKPNHSQAAVTGSPEVIWGREKLPIFHFKGTKRKRNWWVGFLCSEKFVLTKLSVSSQLRVQQHAHLAEARKCTAKVTSAKTTPEDFQKWEKPKWNGWWGLSKQVRSTLRGGGKPYQATPAGMATHFLKTRSGIHSWMRDFWHLMLQIRAARRYLHACTRSRPAISFCCSASILHHSSSSSTAALHPHVVTICAEQVLPSGSFSATKHCLFVCASPQW